MLDITMTLRNDGVPFDNETSLSVTRATNYNSELEVIGEFLCNFLNSAGYLGFKNDYLLLESLTEDELDYLQNVLYEYRKNLEEKQS